MQGGETAFYWACDGGHTDIVRMMLEHGEELHLDVNVQNDVCETGVCCVSESK